MNAEPSSVAPQAHTEPMISASPLLHPLKDQRGIALGGKSWLFADSDRGGQRAAAMSWLVNRVSVNQNFFNDLFE
jgi:hypothetical protein